MSEKQVGEPLWAPSEEWIAGTELAHWLRDTGAADYEALWRWSVDDLPRFWRSVWDRYGVVADGDPAVVLANASMPGAVWFRDVALSFPEHVFRGREPGELALQAAAEDGSLVEWTWERLRRETARVRAGLEELGVGRGDRVAACLPNVAETVAAFLAVSSLGAVWSCCSPDFGVRTIVDRFLQIEPKVLLVPEGTRYAGRERPWAEHAAQLRDALPTVERVVTLPVLGTGDWDEAFPDTGRELSFARVPFDHPLWILYSSGTTGLPKAIVHGHGGILLEHLKVWRLHHDVRPGDRVFWFTTTGWMMWNYLVGALLSPVSIVLYDGSPGHPDLNALWDVADRAGVNIFGGGAAYFHACLTAGIDPRAGRGLAGLRQIGSTGSPLSPAGFRWLHDRLGAETWLVSISGGTDVASAFVGGVPVRPLYAGEIQGRLLGAAVEAWDAGGRPLVDEVGELVLTKPLPSMPVCFWNDPDGARLRESYFAMYPGVWRHGDWIRITPRGSCVIYGRSDSTINRGGIRMGTAEIYAAVLAHDAVVDALAVDVPAPDGSGESWLGLFVVLREGETLSGELVEEVRRLIRRDCSPRHVPDEVIAVPALPRTLTGKLLEVPVKRVLMGDDVSAVVSRDALEDPAALDWFVELAERRRTKYIRP